MEIKDFIEAITHSCDAYFYQFGNAAGIDAIDRVGKTLGLGQPTGIELTDEVPGLLPSPDWLKTTKNERWTPVVTATIANGGTYYQLTLIIKFSSLPARSFKACTLGFLFQSGRRDVIRIDENLADDKPPPGFDPSSTV